MHTEDLGRRPIPAALLREAVDAFAQRRDTVADPALGRLATAIYVEDTFAVTLTDDDIELLGTLAGLRTVLARHHRDA
jgi:hypothetical protein